MARFSRDIDEGPLPGWLAAMPACFCSFSGLALASITLLVFEKSLMFSVQVARAL